MTGSSGEGATDPSPEHDPTGQGAIDGGLSATGGHDPLINGYRSFTPIGQGGFSIVYTAYQDRFDRTVAVKVISSDLRDSAAARRFTRECRVVGKLTGHPNIITVFEAGSTADRRPFIAMQYLPGGSVADLLRRNGPLGVADTLRIGAAIADALQAAHKAKILHRDVKPGNILLSERGDPVLSDFGIASRGFGADMSASQDAFTPSFAAPEVLRGDEPSVASDLYGLGATMYAMLAGTPPFGVRPGDSLATMMLRALTEELAPIRRGDVHSDVDGLLRALLARDPSARPRDAATAADELRRLHSLEGLTRRPAPRPPADPPPAPADPSPGAARPAPAPEEIVPPSTLGPGNPGAPDRSRTSDDAPPAARSVAPDRAAAASAPLSEHTTAPGPAPAAAPAHIPEDPEEDAGAPAHQPGHQLHHGLEDLSAAGLAGARPPGPPADEVSGQRDPDLDDDRPMSAWRRWIRITVPVAVGLAVAMLLVIGLLVPDGDSPPGPGSASSTLTASGAPDPTDPSSARPSGLRAVDNGTVIRLTWTNGSAPGDLVLRVFDPATAIAAIVLPAGATVHELKDVDPEARYCFTVGAILGVTRESGVEGAWSDFACIRDATPPPTQK
ncbi:Serine/threonine protein kinase [Parafrankia irregularis]|uniref:non-specific serine/threonine protein kinase n=2 Tax=Parafrankia TaxID=2994362 RepID=A0A0S4QWH7_9ACTN|nr:serine/threonine-protein kinase [Parafrankia irregularis]CUU59228.1 Serine/threonine protein kinase [Parafrankia irregularis]